MSYILYCDGACRGNPGPSSSAALIIGPNDFKIKHGQYIGETTNSVAEYKSLILGLKLCEKNNLSNVIIKMDSKLVVNQVNGLWKIKADHLKKYHKKCVNLLNNNKLEWIPRNENSDVDKIANEVLDKI